MASTLHGISSMATRAVLGELAASYAESSGVAVHIESVGGVDAAARVAAGEPFDLVFLASDALDKLIHAGHVCAPRVDLVHSAMAVACREGSAAPSISTEEALKAAVRAAPTLGYSTGPSGNHVLRLFERWGLKDELAPKLVQARPGVPVGQLVAAGEAALGFQQLSELLGLPGIWLLGELPAGAAFVTTFSGAVAATSTQPEAAAAVLAAFNAPATASVKRRHGMTPVSP